MKKIKAAIVISSIVIIAITLFQLSSTNINIVEEKNKKDVSLNYRADVCWYKNDNFLGCNKNILTNNGKDQIKLLVGSGSNDPAKVIVLGNGSAPISTSTYHPSEIRDCNLTGATATYQSNGVGWWNETYTFISSCNNEVVNTTGLNTTAGVYFAGTTISTVTLNSVDTLKIVWNISVNES
jgi:hypothetical protein